jgi:hypothetical protein
MTPESRNSSLLGNGSANTFPRKRTRATIEEPASEQRIGKHTIEVLLETVFSMGAAPIVYNEDLGSCGIELRESLEMAVEDAAEEKPWCVIVWFVNAYILKSQIATSSSFVIKVDHIHTHTHSIFT